MIKYYFIVVLLLTIIFPHQIDDPIKWKQYYRASYIVNESHDYGLGGYFRLKRTTKYTFKDLRVFLHFVEGESYKKIRYKDSSKFRDWTRFYNYTTVAIDQNSKIGVDLRYHGNQGIGLFIKNFEDGHINAEVGLAYDISDYLNDSAKTSYLKSGIYWDQKLNDYEIKFEIENYKQITDVLIEDLSRTEILFEIYVPIRNNLRVVLGYEYEDFNNSNNSMNSSVFLSIAYYDIFNISKFKNRLF